LSIAEPSREGLRELGKGRILTGRCWSVPVLSNGKIYARNAAGDLVCVKLAPPGGILPGGLVAHWSLDEAEGDIAGDSALGRDGVLSGSPQWQPDDGKAGGALEFDGIDDYVTTPHIISPEAGDFSVFVWIKGGVAGQVILSQQDGANWLMADAADGTLRTDLRSPATTGRGASPLGPPLISTAIVSDGEWRRIGLVRAGDDRILYVDGAEVARDTAIDLEPASTGFYIGAAASLDPAGFFAGLIDDVRIYNIALSAEEITAFAR
jgi:hypothetical protein